MTITYHPSMSLPEFTAKEMLISVLCPEIQKAIKEKFPEKEIVYVEYNGWFSMFYVANGTCGGYCYDRFDIHH